MEPGLLAATASLISVPGMRGYLDSIILQPRFPPKCFERPINNMRLSSRTTAYDCTSTASGESMYSAPDSGRRRHIARTTSYFQSHRG
ncbi:hypothetical protein HDV57DRAFT_199275 [Trichoderma longibrachiatum]|uniref:Uncharacterized protein n=1 Tax=Trichoderma longibrachiatum ATCC 18648 TaxID=983965 RepID=A0A2T4C8F7_TRILO|nr:hypothetical protein M440DRAFT_1225305 [Trichoderma longibrachiatum ATCC 18648]